MPYTLNGQPVSDQIGQAYMTPGAGAYPVFPTTGTPLPVGGAGRYGGGGGGGASGYTSTGGGNPYGTKPSPVPIPPSLWQQAGQQVPGLGPQAGNELDFITSESKGVMSPATTNAIADATAAWGQKTGLGSDMAPGTIGGNRNLRNIGLNTEALQQRSVSDYTGLLGSIAGLQTQPNLAAEIEAYNSQLAGAPDPAAVAAKEEQLWQSHFKQLMDLVGPTSQGPARGTGVYSPPIVGGPRSPGTGATTGGVSPTEAGGSWSPPTGEIFQGGYQSPMSFGPTNTTRTNFAGNTGAPLPGYSPFPDLSSLGPDFGNLGYAAGNPMPYTYMGGGGGGFDPAAFANDSVWQYIMGADSFDSSGGDVGGGG